MENTGRAKRHLANCYCGGGRTGGIHSSRVHNNDGDCTRAAPLKGRKIISSWPAARQMPRRVVESLPRICVKIAGAYAHDARLQRAIIIYVHHIYERVRTAATFQIREYMCVFFLSDGAANVNAHTALLYFDNTLGWQCDEFIMFPVVK